jgi:hypothetical protein
MHSKPTIAQLAQSLNVSRRAVFLAMELRDARPDLAERVLAGEIGLTAALRIAKPQKYAKPASGPLQAVQRAWERASEDDRAAIVEWLGAELSARRSAPQRGGLR